MTKKTLVYSGDPNTSSLYEANLIGLLPQNAQIEYGEGNDAFVVETEASQTFDIGGSDCFHGTDWLNHSVIESLVKFLNPRAEVRLVGQGVFEVTL